MKRYVGTHNSCCTYAYEHSYTYDKVSIFIYPLIRILNVYAKTQHMSIREQLEKGIEFFDVRYTIENNTENNIINNIVNVTHGPYFNTTEYTLLGLINEIKMYLSEKNKQNKIYIRCLVDTWYESNNIEIDVNKYNSIDDRIVLFDKTYNVDIFGKKPNIIELWNRTSIEDCKDHLVTQLDHIDILSNKDTILLLDYYYKSDFFAIPPIFTDSSVKKLFMDIVKVHRNYSHIKVIYADFIDDEFIKDCII